MYDDNDYEEKYNAIRSVNAELLDIFEKDLTDAGFSEKTIRSHAANVSFYINTFLLSEDVHPMEDGVGMVGRFLGDFFIRKCMWSTPSTIKSTAASIKKFYKCMLDHGKIQKAEFDYLRSEIKENMENWQADCAMYNDSDEENPFDWF